MNTVRINGFILQVPSGEAYVFCSSEMPEYGYKTICPHVLTFEIPADAEAPVPELTDVIY